jgi:hypothetical protein
MDGDTQATSRGFDRRLLLIALAFVLAAAAIWASTSLAGGSAPSSPAKAKVSQVNKAPGAGGFYTGGNGGSGRDGRDCPFKHRADTSADV